MSFSVALPTLSWLGVLDALDLAADTYEQQSIACPRCGEAIDAVGIPCAVHTDALARADQWRLLRQRLSTRLPLADRAGFVSPLS